MTPLPASKTLTILEKWRSIACDFPAVRSALAAGTLSPNFEPADLARLRRKPSTGAIKGVYSFLLHIWNSANRFDLAEVSRWDEEHIKAFSGWTSGSKTGWACHYF